MNCTRYESIEEFIKAGNVNLFERNSATWVGSRSAAGSWDGARDKFNNVWKIGMDTMQRFIDRLVNVEIDVKSHVRRTRFNEDDGDEVDLDRLRSGQPFWRRSEREITSGPTELTVFVDWSTHVGVSPDNVLWRGAAALAIVKILEEKGYRVELWATYNYVDCSTKKRFSNGILMKRTSDSMDVSTTTSAISSWFYRTLAFTTATTQCGHYSGSRRPEPCTGDELDYYSRDENRIYIAGVFSFDGAMALVKAELSKLSSH